MTTPNRPPLWREMVDAYCDATDSVARDMETIAIGTAAEIRALRDRIFLGGRPDPVGVSPDCLAIWDELTAEADRAEQDDNT